MEDASRIMYKIANVLNWILLVLCAVLFIFGIFFTANAASLASSGKYTMNDHVATADDITSAGIALIIVAVWLIIIDVLFIVFTRIAAKKESSQGWDILFLVLGLLSGSIFYTLGGLFGIIAKNQTSTPATK